MIKELINGSKKKLNVFVVHEPVESVELVLIKVVQPMLLLSQSPLELIQTITRRMCHSASSVATTAANTATSTAVSQ
jgi:hypothetical protein